MHDIAIAVTALAALVGIVLGIRTVLNHRADWRRTSAVQLSGGCVAGLSSVSLAAHSPALDLITMAAALAYVVISIYTAKANGHLKSPQ